MTTTGEAVSFGRRVHDLAREAPAEVAVVFATTSGHEVVITREELDRRSTQVARLLDRRGIGRSGMVAIGLPNSPEHLYVALGAWKVGACVLPLRADLPAWERDRLLAAAEASVLVASGDAPVPVIRPADLAGTVAEPTDPLPDVVAQPAIAMASSGSTGRPKLIVSPWPGAAIPGATPPITAAYLDLPPELPQLVPAPLYHTNGFALAHSTIFNGDLVVLMERFDAGHALELVERHRVRCFAAVPTMLARMARVPDVHRRDLSSLVYVVQGGASCPEWVVEAWIDLIGAERFFVTYGSTERVGLTLLRGDEWLEHRGSVGRGHNTEVRVLREDGRDAAPGEVGEIFMRRTDLIGPTFEYRGAPPPPEVDGFTSIGDLGWLDADGYLYVADRRSDMFVSGGANVFPAEVEAALSEHPGVHDVVVIGLADPEWGRRVHALVEPVDPTSPPSPADLDAHARARLAPYKVPKAYEIVTRIPRTEAGKVNRVELAAAREP